MKDIKNAEITMHLQCKYKIDWHSYYLKFIFLREGTQGPLNREQRSFKGPFCLHCYYRLDTVKVLHTKIKDSKIKNKIPNFHKKKE